MKITKKGKLLILFLFIFLHFGVYFAPIQATTKLWDSQMGMEAVGDVAFEEDSDNVTDIRVTIGVIIRAFLGFLGAIFVVLIIYAGFLWMTAGGNQDRITQSKSYLMNSIVGLVIILSAMAVTQFVLGCVLAASAGDVGNPWYCG